MAEGQKQQQNNGDSAEAAAAPATTNPAPNGNELTADEAAVYDRQLRVWGVEVQRK